MATARTRKRRTAAAMAAWTAAAGPGFWPVDWSASRSPRLRHRIITNEIGRYEGFSYTHSGGAFVSVLHSR
jgi:hypothetical protein